MSEECKMEEEIYCKYCSNKGRENFMEYFNERVCGIKSHFYRCKKCKKDNLYPFDIRIENKIFITEEELNEVRDVKNICKC